jgi:hypothetical protein
MSEVEYWRTKLREAEAELEAARKRSDWTRRPRR